MNDREKLVYEAKAKVIKALAHPTRLWMVEKLSEGSCCVCEFESLMNVDFSTISKHLSLLKEAGILSSEKVGKQVFYSLKVPCILNFIQCVDAVLEANIADNRVCCSK